MAAAGAHRASQAGLFVRLGPGEALPDYAALAARMAPDAAAAYHTALEALQEMLPQHPVHMERALGGRLNHRWRVIVPGELAGLPEEKEA